MKLSEAFDVCLNASNVSLSTLTSNDVILIEQAFVKFVEQGLTSLSCVLVPQTDTSGKRNINNISETLASEYVKSTGIVKNILAFKNNKNISNEQSLVNVFARILLGRLQNVGDNYSVSLENKFTIRFVAVDDITPGVDWDAIKADNNIDDSPLTMSRIKDELISDPAIARLFRNPSLSGNPSVGLAAMKDGTLDRTKYDKTRHSFNVDVIFEWFKVDEE